MKVTAAFERLPSTGEQAKIMTRLLITAIKEGEVNPMELKTFLKHFEGAMEEVWKDKEVEVEFMAEAEKWRGQACNGFTVDIREAGTRYDFDRCEDPEWDTWKTNEDRYKKNRSEREAFLKAVKEPFDIVTGDGEVVTVKPPVKVSKTSIFLTKVK